MNGIKQWPFMMFYNKTIKAVYDVELTVLRRVGQEHRAADDAVTTWCPLFWRRIAQTLTLQNTQF